MKSRGWGRVLTIGSIQQLKPSGRMLVYAGTKSAQYNWVRNLARQVGPTGVTVNNLAPVPFWTARNDERLADDAHAPSSNSASRRPCRQGGGSRRRGAAAVFGCRRYINGADLFVDGGLAGDVTQRPARPATMRLPRMRRSGGFRNEHHTSL